MPRACSVCSLPARIQAEQQLRSGVSLSEIALSYGVSQDALSRHKRHLDRPTGSDDRVARLQARLAKADAEYENAITLGDFRLVDSINRRIDRLEGELSKVQSSGTGTFESLSLTDKVAYICKDRELFQKLLDLQVVWYDQAMARRQEQEAELAAYNERTRRVVEALETRGQQADSKP